MVGIVLGHVKTSVYRGVDLPWSWSDFPVNTFLLPSFFIISGFLTRNSITESRMMFLKKKFEQLVVPAFLFIVLWSFHSGSGLIYCLSNVFKAGYWFTLILFVYFFLYVIISVIKISSSYKEVLLVIVGLLLLLSDCRHLKLLYDNHFWMSFFSFPMLKYFIYFVIGVLMRNHYSQFKSLIENKWFLTVLILCFIGTLLKWFHAPISFGIFEIKFRFIILGLGGSLIVWSLFSHHQDTILKNKIGKALVYLGTHTLDIYFLHYFFLQNDCSFLGHFFSNHPMPTIELFVSLIIAMMIISLSLIVSNIVRLSPTLAHWLLGVKRLN